MKRTEELEKIRDLSDSELQDALLRAREELFRHKIGLMTEQVENISGIKLHRRKVAQILTVISQRQKGLEVQAQGTSAAG